jgi:hypothetical protein
LPQTGVVERGTNGTWYHLHGTCNGIPGC